MIRIQASGFAQFMAAFGVLHGAGVQLTASGGNAMTVPDDTGLDLLRAVAATGAVVHADLSVPVEENPSPTADGDVGDDTPAEADAATTRKPRKNATRRKTTRE